MHGYQHDGNARALERCAHYGSAPVFELLRPPERDQVGPRSWSPLTRLAGPQELFHHVAVRR
jgi:hypothetical protein